MSAGREFKLNLGLARAEMQVALVVRIRSGEWRKIDVDEQVVVPGVGKVDACRRDPAPLSPMRTQNFLSTT